MKKWMLLTLLITITTFSTVGAEKWEDIGLWGAAKVQVDTDSIRPVTPANSSFPIRFSYQFTMRLSGRDYQLTQTQVVDLRRNYTLLQKQEQTGTVPPDFLKTFRGAELNKWTPNTYGLTLPTLYGYIYTNEEVISDREPYALKDTEKAVFTNTSYTSPGVNWKTAFERDRLNAWILTSSIQITEPQEGQIPTIRFLGTTSYDEAISRMEYLFLLESNVNPPNQHKIYYQWERTGSRRSSSWELFVKKSDPQSKALDNKSDLAYLTATAYIYLLTHPEEFKKTLYFVPGELEKTADKWLKMAN